MHYAAFFPFPLFGFLFFLIIVFIVGNIARHQRAYWCRQGMDSSMDLLEKRYVNGEIDENEFHKIKANLKKK
ncbi:hypothetical protein [Sporolactobacillus pectinivorans]|uniref:hypothetical protein n=1 Tax=Sporolactobacillus pectinivorans TaxID=1591408 RepID=UPI000C25FEA4|nr:hypothetical protein [Sporolactobacillus pectinivorans]